MKMEDSLVISEVLAWVAKHNLAIFRVFINFYPHRFAQFYLFANSALAG